MTGWACIRSAASFRMGEGTDMATAVAKPQTAGVNLFSASGLSWTIIGYGILLRLAQYLFNRSLWLDECLLALNIVNRTFNQLLKPLDYFQGAPAGFLMVERSAVQIIGSSEYALRLFPFLCGIVSLLLFYRLAKLCVSSQSVPIALGLFASSDHLIYYSSEAKQYSSDVAIALCVLLAAIFYQSRRLTPVHLLLFGLLGATSIWFSHPSVFVLCGIGVSLSIFCVVERQWARVGSLLIVFSIWAVSLAACYFVSLRHLSTDTTLLSYWSSSFPPSPLFSAAAAEWFISTCFGIFKSPVGLELTGLAAFTFLVGFVWMFSNKKQTLLILMSPIPLTLIAAAFHKYPFSGRLLLFAAPALLLVIAEGTKQIWSQTKAEAPMTGACLIGLLFFFPVLNSSYRLIRPRAREEIRPVINYVKEHEDAGDVLYVHRGAVPGFRYYAPRLELSRMRAVQGIYSKDNWGGYEKDLEQFQGPGRVWFLFSHTDSDTGFIDEERLFLYFLDKRGKRVDSFKSIGAAVYLYDLGQSNSASADLKR